MNELLPGLAPEPCPVAGLAPIRLEDRPTFDEAFALLKNPISDYTFAGVYLWSASLRLWWAVIRRHVCVFSNGFGDLTMLLPPLALPGASTADLVAALDESFAVMDEFNARTCDRSHSRIEYLSDETLARVLAIPGRDYVVAPMWPDYVYDTARMIDLAGGDLKGKRKARSRFLRQSPDHRTEPLTPAHTDACLRLLHSWTDRRDATHEGEVNAAHIGTDILRAMEVAACTRALHLQEALGLTGLALFVGDELAGFTIGEALSPLQSLVIIEKTDPRFDGAAQFIFSEFIRLHWADFPEVNVSDDWGIPTLRFTKESYRPIRMLSKFMISRQPADLAMGFNPVEVPVENRKFVHLAADRTTPDSVRLRTAGPADTDQILAIEEISFESPGERFTRRQIKALISNQRALVTVAELDGRVVGWAAALVRQHRRWKSGRLYAIAIHPEMRGRRLGRMLAEHTFDALASNGITRLFLEVRENNHPAIALYASLGFVRQKALPNYYGYHVHGLRMARLVKRSADAEASSPPAPPPAPAPSAR